MEVIRSSLLCFLFVFLATHAYRSPVGGDSQPLRILPFIVKKSDGSVLCDSNEVFTWTNDFHECFIDRKYKDGGRNLESIVDRILVHSETCMEMSSKECRPDFNGFAALMNKTITQMKDYAQMYLENIYRGRERINDLTCVETVLSLKTYEDCFRHKATQDADSSEESFQKIIEEGISCVNRANAGCSREAKTALNAIVRIICGVERPLEEKFEEEITTTEPPPPPTESHIYPVYSQESDSRESEESQEEYERVKPTEAPAPWMWYDYLAYPFVQAYKWVSSLFSG